MFSLFSESLEKVHAQSDFYMQHNFARNFLVRIASELFIGPFSLYDANSLTPTKKPEFCLLRIDYDETILFDTHVQLPSIQLPEYCLSFILMTFITNYPPAYIISKLCNLTIKEHLNLTGLLCFSIYNLTLVKLGI